MNPVVTTDLLQLLIAFTLIWVGAGVLIGAIEKLSRLLRLSQFTLSLFLLGTATSFPEIAVMVNSLVLGQPEVSMGNLVGGQVFLFFLVIPILAVITRGLRFQVQMQGKLLLLVMAVVAAPLLTLLDGQVLVWEAMASLLLYGFFAVTFASGMRTAAATASPVSTSKKPTRMFSPTQPIWELAKVFLGVLVLLGASQLAIRGVTSLSLHLQLHPFLVSLVAMALGTNLPEFSLAVRGVLSGKKAIALGDYIGSATFNTLIWALLVLITRGSVSVSQPIWPLILVIGTGLVLFWKFCHSQKKLTLWEALGLVGIYVSFLGVTAWVELTN